MNQTVPYLKVKLTGTIFVEVEGEPIFNSNVNLSLVVTEKDSAKIIEGLTPKVIDLASQIGEVIAQKIVEAESQKNKSDPFRSIFGHPSPFNPPKK